MKAILFKVICIYLGLWICLQASADVVINEGRYDPNGTDTGLEWIELYNHGGSVISLNGYCLYASTEHYVFGTFSLGAGAYVIVHWNADGTDTLADLYTGTADWSNMGNTSGSVALWNTHDAHTKDTIVDYMEYGAGGQSYESTAVNAGIWTADDFAADVDKAHSLEYDGSGDAGSDWFDQSTPTPGADHSLPVTLSLFTTIPTDSGVKLKWRTESEVDNIGFNIYRSEKKDGTFIKLNQKLIPSAGNSAMPNDYQFTDKTAIKDKQYYYYLEDVNVSGLANKSSIISINEDAKRLTTTWCRIKRGD